MKRVLDVEVLFGQDSVYADQETGALITALVRVKPLLPSKKHPVNITWIQDISGSMRDGKLDDSKRVLSGLIDNLDRSDFASLVVFNQNHETVFRENRMTAALRDELKARIQKLYPDGYTCIAEPISEVVDKIESDEACKKQLSSNQRTVVMLTDGKSEGVDEVEDRRKVKEAVRKLRKLNCARLVLVGIGVHYNHDFLEEVSQIGPDFELFHVSTTDISELDRTISDVMCEIRASFVRELSVQGSVVSGITLKSATTFAPSQRDVEIHDNSFTRESSILSTYRGQQILIEMTADKPKSGEKKLLTLVFSGLDAEGKKFEEKHDLRVKFTNNKSDALIPIKREVFECVIRAQAHRRLRANDFDSAIALFNGIKDFGAVEKVRLAQNQFARGGEHVHDAQRTMKSYSSRTSTNAWATNPKQRRSA